MGHNALHRAALVAALCVVTPSNVWGTLRRGIEDLASIFCNFLKQNMLARCTDPVRVDKRNRGPRAVAQNLSRDLFVTDSPQRLMKSSKRRIRTLCHTIVSIRGRNNVVIGGSGAERWERYLMGCDERRISFHSSLVRWHVCIL